MQPDNILPSPAPNIAFYGKTRHKTTGLPISGVELSWIARLNGHFVGKQRAIVLGNAVSGEKGSFCISLNDDPEAVSAYRLLDVSDSSRSEIVATNAGVVSEAVTVRSKMARDIVIEVESKAKASAPARQLKSLAEFLAVNRIGAAGELQRQIAEPVRESPVREWSLSARLKSLAELDIEMKDKDIEGGKGQWQSLDLDIMAGGDLKGSIRDGIIIPDRYPDRPFAEKSNLALYRDYLRGIWVSAAGFMHEQAAFSSGPVPTRTRLEHQLNNRLHQNFRIWSEIAAPAPRLLAGILKSALAAPTEFGGFGKASTDIPAKATNQSDDDYLAALVTLSGTSRAELEKRFRVSFEPAPGEQTTPIQLNVDALRGFLSDSFQGPVDPYDATPDAKDGARRTIILRSFAGKAPFYLQYEEWLERQKAFHCENLFDVRKTIPYFSPPFRNEFAGMWGGQDIDYSSRSDDFVENDQVPQRAPEEGVAPIPARIFEFIDKLHGAIWQIDNNDYGGAATSLNILDVAGGGVLSRLLAHDFYRSEYVFQSASYGEMNRAINLEDRAGIDTSTPEGLAALEGFFRAPDFPLYNPFWPTGRPEANIQMDPVETMARNKAKTEFAALCVHWLFYVNQVTIPIQRARIAQALGDHAGAARILCKLTGVVVGVAEPETPDVYNDMSNTAQSSDHFRWLFRLDSLPYTTTIFYSERTDRKESRYPLPLTSFDRGARSSLMERFTISPCEWRAYKLAQGRAMLDWADQLFRNDEPSSIRRARELYKGVLILHGVDPGIFPQYPKEGEWPMSLVTIISNPAIRAQVARANHGLFLIKERLNAYGWRDDMVPILRYRPLKDNSDALATSAKSAQNEFLTYTASFEQSQLDRMQAAVLIEKANATVKIADEQIAIGRHDVQSAQKQVKELEKQIEKKQEEIDDKDSIFNQFSDYLSGLKKAAKNMKGDGKEKKSGEGDFTGYMETGFWMKSFSALGVGAGYIAGIGLFYYASYVSMEGMEKEANKRGSELKKMRDTALPAAKAQVMVKQRMLTIANLQKQIAEADLQYAKALSLFHRDRFLSAETWAKLASLAEQMMAFYVDTGARMGWLAERALAFEQSREINIIRKNYLPRAMRGVTGADVLQADLASLENSRLLGLKLTMPIKHSVSLARQFPLAFGALKSTGRCSFFTEEAFLRSRYPGLFGARIRAVTVAVGTAGATAFRGVLRNRGVSSVGTDADGNEQILLRFPDALPISEFRLERDMQVFGLPGETLMQFEGSGFTSQWDIALFEGDDSLDELIDVEITFDGFAFYNDDLFVEPPTVQAPTGGTVLFAGSRLNPVGLDAVMTGEAQQLTIDLTGLAALSGSGNRVISNVALISLGTAPAGIQVAPAQGATTNVVFNAEGIAASNAPPFDSTDGENALNALQGVPLDQAFTLTFEQGDWSKLDDIVFYVEYGTQ